MRVPFTLLDIFVTNSTMELREVPFIESSRLLTKRFELECVRRGIVVRILAADLTAVIIILILSQSGI